LKKYRGIDENLFQLRVRNPKPLGSDKFTLSQVLYPELSALPDPEIGIGGAAHNREGLDPMPFCPRASAQLREFFRDAA
jgi:hypothetical protein